MVSYNCEMALIKLYLYMTHKPQSGYKPGVNLIFQQSTVPSQYFTLIFGGRLNDRCYFSVKKSSHRERKFRDVNSRLYTDGHQVVMEEECQQQSQSENTHETR